MNTGQVRCGRPRLAGTLRSSSYATYCRARWLRYFGAIPGVDNPRLCRVRL